MNKAVMKPIELINTLNILIETCRDGQQGFAEAYENLRHIEIRDFCHEQSRSRAYFVGQLQQEVQLLGGSPENTGSTSGFIHRAWINLKSALGGGDQTILSACETGEESALVEYEKALKLGLPSQIYSMVENQYLSIQQSLLRLSHMRDSLDADNSL